MLSSAAEANSLGDSPGYVQAVISQATRGSMLDAAEFPDQDLRPHIRIIGSERDGQEVLEVHHRAQNFQNRPQHTHLGAENLGQSDEACWD